MEQSLAEIYSVIKNKGEWKNDYYIEKYHGKKI